jgi:NadR type nicotinamide-nucleotide adenylyltransferase
MEKGLQKDKILKIVITGPESTGKSTLSEQLAKHYQTIFIAEYARTYVENLGRPYTFNDVEHIARRQIEELKENEGKANKIMFADTYLIITKVWFDVVYKQCPEWVTKAILQSDIDLYLLCSTDLPWEPDSVRENGGEMREKLFCIYEQELIKFNLPYVIVNGIGDERLENAVKLIEDFFKN